jgi:dephospho-CoA kinase
MKKFVAIVGLVGAGKTTASQYLEKKGFKRIRFGQVVIDEVKRRGWKINEKSERLVREGLRKESGMDVMAKLNYPKIKKALRTTYVIGDDIYSWEEYLYLKKKLKERMVVLHIFASPQGRYQRMARRKVRPLSAKQARSRDYADIANIQKAGPIAMADEVIVNEGKVGELEEKLDKFLAKFDLSIV